MNPLDTALSATRIVAFLQNLFDNCTDTYLGEQVTVSQHMLQGATLAQREGKPVEVIVGALLHDIGHVASNAGCFAMDDTWDRRHEDAGAQLLASHFPQVIVDCVRYHVDAKRYLCATQPDYFARLSPASVHSLNLQGGPMSAAEAEAFEKQVNFKTIIQVRYFDEAGKCPDLETPDFAHFAPLVQGLVDAHGRAGA
ncbi:HD domain-containing protein [Marinobacterium rhizophilum]|uniref:HD domain-containing protein n=1 Tax=Marinobacterium rhizophilum TaxID=420402 RepID=A0ABY5HQ29_9GAMM|nr:HD domain-containing protein [Marinobacterium rhizophilum]UTW13668.1 HD domain-containing protein [Marinobacterium rhizophilum]